MSGVDLTDQFLQYYSFLHKVSNGQRNSLCIAWTWLYLIHTFSTRNIQTARMHWQFRTELVKHMLSNAWQQPWGIVPVPDPVDCPFCLVDKHFIEPMQGQEGGRRKHPRCACFICNMRKRHCHMQVLGTVTNPKSTPLTGVQYVSVYCVLILVLVYITLKRTTQLK